MEETIDKSKQDVLIRLRKVEGQVRGIHKMIEEGRDCQEVVRQLCASRKALDKVGFMVLTNLMKECVKESGEDFDKAMSEAMQLFLALA